ncbi:hypothetical protein [Exiguobacterium sp. RIT452]|nr:hypothetical protein [Exiguobacterium sp. RIT452]
MGILLIVTVAFLPIFYNMHKRLRILEVELPPPTLHLEVKDS